MNEIYLSIIIPVYNIKYSIVKRAVRSVIGKHLDTTEVIIVDDGSIEEIGYELDDISKNNSTVRIIHTRNGGVSKARNVGIEAAKGEYIAFLDGDDIVSESFLDEAYKYGREYKADIIFGGFIGDVEYKEKQDLRLQIIQADIAREIMRSYYDLKPRIISARITGTVCGCLYRREMLNSIRFKETIKICEDQIFFREIIQKATEVMMVPAIWYVYLYRETSAMHKNQQETLLMRMLPYITELKKLAGNEFSTIRDYLYLDILNVYGAIIKKDCIESNDLTWLRKQKLFFSLSKDDSIKEAIDFLYNNMGHLKLKKKVVVFLLHNHLSELYFVLQIIVYKVKESVKIISKKERGRGGFSFCD